MLLRKENLFTLLCFLAIASALDATLEKSVFFVASVNYLNSGMFRTSQGIIAHSTPNYTGIPRQDEYQLINLKNHSVTQVLVDVVAGCGQDAFEYDKLHYHAATATLVYYCLVNNSLLILDEQDWTVQSSIATNIIGNFSEVKIVSDGYSIAILGMGPLFTEAAIPSQLIKVDLQEKQIVNNVTFDHDLRSGERVTGYASTGKDLYIVTNTIGNSSNNVTVYSMSLIVNSYNITPLASVNNTYNTIVTWLYCIGDLIVTNSEKTVVIISNQGTILGKVEKVQGKFRLVNQIAIASEYGSGEFYALLEDSTLCKVTYKNGGYSKDIIAKEMGDFQLAYGSFAGNALLLTTGFWGNFTIQDIKTSEIVYTMIDSFSGYLTDTAYIMDASDGFYYFSRETDALLQVVTDLSDLGSLFEPESLTFSFLNQTDEETCQLVQFHFDTQALNVVWTYKSSDPFGPCPGSLLNITTNEHGTQAVLQDDLDDSYLIISQTFGNVNFTVPNPDFDENYIAVDYDTLTVYYFKSSDKSSEILTYEYDSTTGNFSLKDTINITVHEPKIFYTEAKQLFAISAEGMDVITLPGLDQKIFGMDSPYNQIDSFIGNEGTTYTILTSFIDDTPEIFFNGEFSLLPGGNDYTLKAGAAGGCSYWVQDQVDNFELLRFYDICSKKKSEKIYA